MLEDTQEPSVEKLVSFGPLLPETDAGSWENINIPNNISLGGEFPLPNYSNITLGSKSTDSFEQLSRTTTNLSPTTSYSSSFSMNTTHEEHYPGGSRVIRRFPNEIAIGNSIDKQAWSPDESSNLGIDYVEINPSFSSDTILAYLEVDLFDSSQYTYGYGQELKLEVYSEHRRDNSHIVSYSHDSSKLLLPLSHCLAHGGPIRIKGISNDPIARFIKEAKLVEYSGADFDGFLDIHSLDKDSLGFVGAAADTIDFSQLNFTDLDIQDSVREMTTGDSIRTSRLFINSTNIYRYVATKVRKVYVFHSPSSTVDEFNNYLNRTDKNIYRVSDLENDEWELVGEVEEDRGPFESTNESLQVSLSATFGEGNIASFSIALVPVRYWKVWRETLPIEVNIRRDDVLLTRNPQLEQMEVAFSL